MNRADRTDIVVEKRNRTVLRNAPLSGGLNDDAIWGMEWNSRKQRERSEYRAEQQEVVCNTRIGSQI